MVDRIRNSEKNKEREGEGEHKEEEREGVTSIDRRTYTNTHTKGHGGRKKQKTNG